jgi:hypothetical protein
MTTTHARGENDYSSKKSQVRISAQGKDGDVGLIYTPALASGEEFPPLARAT